MRRLALCSCALLRDNTMTVCLRAVAAWRCHCRTGCASSGFSLSSPCARISRSPPPPRRDTTPRSGRGGPSCRRNGTRRPAPPSRRSLPQEYDLGDYVVYFGGEAAAREGKRTEAAESLRLLEEKFPGSPLLPYLRHDVAYAAALDNDVAAAREAFGLSRGKVSGSRTKGGGRVCRRVPRRGGGAHGGSGGAAPGEFLDLYGAGGGGPLLRTPLEVARRRPPRGMGPVAGVLREVRQGGRPRRGGGTGEGALRRGDPPFPSLRGIFRADPGLRRVPPEAGGDRGGRRAPGKAPGGRPAGVPVGGALPPARVEWKAGRLAEARKEFLEIADGGCALRGRRTGRGTSPRGSPRTRGISRGRRNRSNVSGAPGTIRSGRRRSSGSPTASTGRAGTTRRSRRSTSGKRGEAGRWSAPGTGTGRRGRFATPAGGRRRRRSSRTWPETRSPGSTRSSRFRSGEARRSGSSTPPPTARRRRAARSANGSGRGSGRRTGGRPTPRRSGGRSG